MAMTERVSQLRQQSLDAAPAISSERAELLTEFYRQNEGRMMSAPAQRALAFRYLMEHEAIYIGAGELIDLRSGQSNSRMLVQRVLQIPHQSFYPPGYALDGLAFCA